ncbi:hypothetical protein AB0A70_27795, partial [Streptomyces morookaense]
MPQEETPPGTDTPPTGIGAAVSDIVGLYAALSVNADPRVMRWVDDGSVRGLDETAEDIERWEEE